MIRGEVDLSDQAVVGGVENGIDVSHHQGSVDWRRVRASGVRFAYIKAIEAGWNDPRFRENAERAGIPVGAYAFLRPDRDPVWQAERLVRVAGRLPLRPAADVEWTGNRWAQLAPKARVEFLAKFLDRLEALDGRVPVIYTSAAFWSETFGPLGDRFRRYPLWVAHYTTAASPRLPRAWNEWTIWQYTDRRQIPGIRGNVDGNRCRDLTLLL